MDKPTNYDPNKKELINPELNERVAAGEGDSFSVYKRIDSKSESKCSECAFKNNIELCSSFDCKKSYYINFFGSKKRRKKNKVKKVLKFFFKVALILSIILFLFCDFKLTMSYN